jgi:hypothetical protein
MTPKSAPKLVQNALKSPKNNSVKNWREDQSRDFQEN